MDIGTDKPPPRAAQVSYAVGDAAVSAPLVAIGGEGCRLPDHGMAPVGTAIVLRFLDGVHVAGRVERAGEGTIDIRFDRPVSSALVRYFAAESPGGAVATAGGVTDAFGRALPPLEPRPRPAGDQA